MDVAGTLVRGGTSKCWLFDARDVPESREALAELLVQAYDAADPSQVDGVGGATPTTSKAAVVGPGRTAGVDVDYLFAQVGIGERRVEWASNCGNCATAIALWSVDRGLVTPVGDRTSVVLRNLNTGSVLEAVVDTPGGAVTRSGVRTVPGLRAGGVGVDLAFRDPAGGTTGALLPSGAPRDLLDIDGNSVPVSLLDAGAPVALAEAAALGTDGAAPADEIRALVPALRRLRREAAFRMRLPADRDSVPKVGVVGAPTDYVTSLGERVSAEEHDVAVRMLSMTAPHPAIGLTSAVAIAAANLLLGSTVHRVSAAAGVSELRIGTPAGVLTVRCDPGPDGRTPIRVTVARAARVLADARIHLPGALAHAG